MSWSGAGVVVLCCSERVGAVWGRIRQFGALRFRKAVLSAAGQVVVCQPDEFRKHTSVSSRHRLPRAFKQHDPFHGFLRGA